MADFWVIRIGDSLVPDGDDSRTVFEKIPQGKPLHCEVKQPRNAKHLRLYWKICHRIADALDRDDIDAEAVSDYFKRATGHFHILQSTEFGEIRVLDSISFAKMDQIAFSEFFEKCIRFCYSEWGIPADVFSDLLEPKGYN